jgi:hypothetical protein
VGRGGVTYELPTALPHLTRADAAELTQLLRAVFKDDVGAANQVERVLGSAYLTEMDAMISRAEAACERYRQAALEEGLSPAVVTRRRSASQTMKDVLARLQAQRGARGAAET